MNRRTEYSSGDLDALAANVARLSRLLTKERDRLPEAYLHDRELRRAYLAYYLPVNIDKIHLPLRELSRSPQGFPARDTLRLLDLGCGPGTSMLGILSFFADRARKPQLVCTAVDGVAGNLRDAEALFRQHAVKYPVEPSLATVQGDIPGIERKLRGSFDLVVFSNVLNELYAEEKDRINLRIATVDAILGKVLSQQGSCIIIEPALRETSRDLLAVRDGLLRAGYCVYSPCLRQGNCPALVHPKDWCHEDRRWDAPGLVREIDQRIGLRKDSLKFSYLVLRKDGVSLADFCGKDPVRIVSEPLVTKGKREYYCCGSEGRRLYARLDRDAADCNHAFSVLQRGDVARFEQLECESGRCRVKKETIVMPLDGMQCLP